MNLLVDQNISFRASDKLREVFPGIKHVSDLGLSGARDIEIWTYSRENDFAIITFDVDFIDLAVLRGVPPKIIWLRLGNTATSELVRKLTSEQNRITEFLTDPAIAFLQIV